MSGWTYLIIAIVGVIVAFVWWRYTSVARGARQRDDRVFAPMAPILERLARNEQVSLEEIAHLAEIPQNRPALYEVLHEMQRINYFPERRLDIRSQAEGRLAYWMMHPNELQDPPEAVEVACTVRRDLDGQPADFLVLRYRMHEGHWAGADWQLGVVGPFFEGSPPYLNVARAFARAGDIESRVEPDELVDWYIALARRKAGRQPAP